MTEGNAWETYKASIMEAAFKADANSRDGGRFDRDDLAPEAGINLRDARQHRLFALAVGELVDEGRMILEDDDASRLSIGTG